MNITLTPEIERALAVETQRQGTTPELLALDCLRRQFVPASGPEREAEPIAEGKSLADFLEGYVGILDSGEIVPGGARMSEDCGKKFAEGMLRKHREGRP